MNMNLSTRMKITKTTSALALLTLALHAFPPFASAAEQQVITLKNWTGRGFAPDFVNSAGEKLESIAAPQFSIAMGLSAGPHKVKISEWEWPALPEAPVRSELTLK